MSPVGGLSATHPQGGAEPRTPNPNPSGTRRRVLGKGLPAQQSRASARIAEGVAGCPRAGLCVAKANPLDLGHSPMSARCWDGAAADPMIGGHMAHIQKYKAHSCGHMLAHYRRDPASLERDNIDPSLTERNMTLGHDADGHVERKPMQPNWEVIAGRIAAVDAAAKAEGKRVTRKDAVVMADLVLTLPENVPAEDGDRFFELSYEFFGEKVGRDNLMGGFVHRDEVRTKKDPDTGKVVRTGERVRDHIHVPWTPILDGRFNFKQQCPRAFYKTLHKELGDYLEARLGYRPDIELSEEQKGEKALSQVKNADIDATRDAIKREEERLECLRQEGDELEPLAVTFGESAATLFAHRGDGSREREQAAEGSRLDDRIAELEQQVRTARERAGELERGNQRLGERLRDVRGRHSSLRERFEGLERRLEGVMAGMRSIPDTLSEWAQDMARRLGKRVYSPNSLSAMREQVESASKQLDTGVSHGRWKTEHR